MRKRRKRTTTRLAKLTEGESRESGWNRERRATGGEHMEGSDGKQEMTLAAMQQLF